MQLVKGEIMQWLYDTFPLEEKRQCVFQSKDISLLVVIDRY